LWLSAAAAAAAAAATDALSRCPLRTLQHLPKLDARYVTCFGAAEVFFSSLSASRATS